MRSPSPDNLVARAAQLAMDAMRAAGRVEIRTHQAHSHEAAGLGGGFPRTRAAILLALPVLAGRVIELAQLIEMTQQLGSDVPFFLLGRPRRRHRPRNRALPRCPICPPDMASWSIPSITTSPPPMPIALLGAGLTSGVTTTIQIGSFPVSNVGAGVSRCVRQRF